MPATRVSPSVPGDCPVVPHVVVHELARGDDLRGKLQIPANATVFGRHGGSGTFNIAFVHEAVLEVSAARPDIYFLFMNTNSFCPRVCTPERAPLERPADARAQAHKGRHCPRLCPQNVINIGPSTNKSSFIRTCDAMLHARGEGETFGLSIADFAAHDRPVITSNVSHDHNRARMHLDTLGTRGIYYYDKPSLLSVLYGFDRIEAARRDWRAYDVFDPKTVMRQFQRVFLNAH